MSGSSEVLLPHQASLPPAPTQLLPVVPTIQKKMGDVHRVVTLGKSTFKVWAESTQRGSQSQGPVSWRLF